jgi:hypothetical protein
MLSGLMTGKKHLYLLEKLLRPLKENFKKRKSEVNTFTAGHLYGCLYLNAGGFKGVF